MTKLVIALVLGLGLSAWADDLEQQMEKLKEQKTQLEIEHAKSEAGYQAQILAIELHIKELELKYLAEEAKKAVEDQGQIPDDAKRQLEKLQSAFAEYVKWAKERLDEGVKKAADSLKPGRPVPPPTPSVEPPKESDLHQPPKKDDVGPKPPKKAPPAENAGKDLYQKGVQAYEAKEFEKAAGLFHKSAEANFELAASLYNEACSWALAGNADKAVAALANSIDKGYDDVDHMTSDEDLAMLHDNPKFQELVKKLTK